MKDLSVFSFWRFFEIAESPNTGKDKTATTELLQPHSVLTTTVQILTTTLTN